MIAIDLFAGLGGFTQAAADAGIRVVWAANHWQAAVNIHAANHPEVSHVCQDLRQANWESVPAHDILLASPCCQGHARARGKNRPEHDKSRSTAWAVVSCAEFHRPPFFVVENVPEFKNWTLFPAWMMAMETIGYSISSHVWDAADSGCPQNRVRLLLVGTRSKSPIEIAPPSRKHEAAANIIDWQAGRWSAVHKPGRAVDSLIRYEHGRASFGDRFLFSYYGNTKTARSLERPIGTITTRDRWAVVAGDRMRMLRVDECRQAMGFPDGYILPINQREAVHMLGNAVPPPLAGHVLSEILRTA